LEFVHEPADRVAEIADAFAQALASRLSPLELARRLKALAPEGTTEGSLYIPVSGPTSSALFHVLQ
jgi:U32 family peptidase